MMIDLQRDLLRRYRQSLESSSNSVFDPRPPHPTFVDSETSPRSHLQLQTVVLGHRHHHCHPGGPQDLVHLSPM
jgi:hypothetical protein